MLSALKNFTKALMPAVILEHYRRVMWLKNLGIRWQLTKGYYQTLGMRTSVDQCNWSLWPAALKEPPYRWALVDVGANEGNFSKAVLSLITPEQVFAFEPLPACQAALENKLSGFQNCHIVPKAVGSHTGSIDFYCTRDTKFSSVLLPLRKTSSFYPLEVACVDQKISVPVVTLDQALAQVERVGLLKIDVQGFELDVLRGATQVLKRTVAVLLEANYVPHYAGAAEFDQVYRFVTDHGFVLAGVSAPFGSRFPLWADAIFVQKSIMNDFVEN